MAVGVAGIWVLLCPTTIAIKGHTDMARGFGEVEILNDPPLIKGIEERFNLTTNTSEQFSAQLQMMQLELCRLPPKQG